MEIVPTDAIKYELDKATGHLRIDRPQLYSSFSPTLYGFIPQTFCGASVGARCAERTGRAHVEGDGDPMDICVLSERDVSHSGVLLRARPIGGLRMIDGNQADDKIIAVLAGDIAYGHLDDVSELPPGVLDRFRHYFLTYKQMPGEKRAGGDPRGLRPRRGAGDGSPEPGGLLRSVRRAVRAGEHAPRAARTLSLRSR